MHAAGTRARQSKQVNKEILHVASRTAMVLPASSCAFTWNFFQKKRSNSMISALPHQLYLLCILTVVWRVLSLWHESQATNCTCYSISFLPLRKILGFFFSMTFRFMLFFAGNVVSGRFISGCEIAALCDILGCPRSFFPIPRESSFSFFALFSYIVMITALLPWPPTQQNNSQLFVVERLMGMFCTIGGASLWLLWFSCSGC